MQVWTAKLNEKIDNNEEREDLEDDAKLQNEIEIPMDAIASRHNVIAIIANETKMATATMVTEQIKNTAKENMVDVKESNSCWKERAKSTDLSFDGESSYQCCPNGSF